MSSKTPGELGVSKSMECDTFLFSAWTFLVGMLEGHLTYKKLDVDLLVVMIWLELCMTYSSSSPVVTSTSIILCFNKHRLTQIHLENGRWNGEREINAASGCCSVTSIGWAALTSASGQSATWPPTDRYCRPFRRTSRWHRRSLTDTKTDCS